MEANGVDSINIIVIPVALESELLCLLSLNVLYCNSSFNRTHPACKKHHDGLT
jgi:hypothetical protein